MTRKAVKGSAIADHLADNVVEDYEPLDFDFPDESVLSIEEEEGKTDWWTMFFDGAVNVYGNRAGAVIISPDKKQTRFQLNYILNAPIIWLSTRHVS
jgi:hypothetical protein